MDCDFWLHFFCRGGPNPIPSLVSTLQALASVCDSYINPEKNLSKSTQGLFIAFHMFAHVLSAQFVDPRTHTGARLRLSYQIVEGTSECAGLYA